MRLEGKAAIVTGGASGFGRGIAARFAKEGAAVAIADLNEAAARETAQAIVASGGRAIGLKADVSNGGDVAAMVNDAHAEFGRIDIVVNNAGMPQRNMSLLDVSEDTFDRIFAVNVKSIFLTAKAVVPLMRAQGGGVIINTASTAALRPRPGLTWYNASKGAVTTMTKSMAVELAPDRIRANALCPVAGDTPMLGEFMGGEVTDEVKARFLATIPLGRFCTPEDMGAAALYFASDEASFITGTCLEVDGGRCV